MLYGLILGLRMLKFFHDIGIYEQTVGGMRSIECDDYALLFRDGAEYVAPIYDEEYLGEDVCCGGHIVYRFSDPAMPEYYRLCRLYEYSHSIIPEKNPYVKKADDWFSSCIRNTAGHFWAGYDDEKHPRMIMFEICPEHPFCEYEFLVLVYDMMEFYRREVITLKNELARCPPALLPALPPPKRRRGRRCPGLEKASVKAS